MSEVIEEEDDDDVKFIQYSIQFVNTDEKREIF